MFDLKTILVFSFSLKTILGLLLFVYSLKNISFKPTFYVALGNIISGTGLLIHSLYPYPTVVVNLLLLNLFVVIGDSMFIVGLWELQKKKYNIKFIATILAVSLIQIFFFTIVYKHNGIRVSINSVIYALIGLYALKEIRVLLKDRLKSINYLFTFIIISHCAVLFIRAIFVIDKPDVDIFSSSSIGLLMHLYIVMAQTSAVFSYVILINQILREELSRAYDKQKELQSFKDNLSTMIVHDLKSPLNALFSSPTLYQGEKLQSLVRNTSFQMLTLVSNILDVNRYEDEKIPFSKEIFNFNDSLNPIIEQLKGLYEPKNLSIVVHGTGTKIFADKQLFDRVVANLLTNAFKFAPNNSTVTIDLQKENNTTRLNISDKGEGIAPEYHQHIFTKYGQVVRKNIGISSSTGLGLTFCKMAIEAQGGSIGIESEFGQGSTFWITLPNHEQMEQEEIQPQTITVEPISVELDAYEKQILKPAVERLRELQVFEFSKITKELDRIDDIDKPSIKNWKETLFNAAFAGNNELFQNLLRIVSE